MSKTHLLLLALLFVGVVILTTPTTGQKTRPPFGKNPSDADEELDSLEHNPQSLDGAKPPPTPRPPPKHKPPPLDEPPVVDIEDSHKPPKGKPPPHKPPSSN
ncbi:hypothetical protein ACOSP7_006779 [Xanthoceras sorbifolium]